MCPKRLIEADPYPVAFELTGTALLVIDMQRDFLEPGGFGEMLGNDVSLLRRTIAPCQSVLEAARAAGLTVILNGIFYGLWNRTFWNSYR